MSNGSEDTEDTCTSEDTEDSEVCMEQSQEDQGKARGRSDTVHLPLFRDADRSFQIFTRLWPAPSCEFQLSFTTHDLTKLMKYMTSRAAYHCNGSICGPFFKARASHEYHDLRCMIRGKLDGSQWAKLLRSGFATEFYPAFHAV